MSPSTLIISLSIALLFSSIVSGWFYPSRRKMTVAFFLAMLVSLPLMLYAMELPL